MFRGFLGRKKQERARRLTSIAIADEKRYMKSNDAGANAGGKKLYVGGIPYSSTEDDLRTLFAQAGAVDSAAIITDRMTGRSKGFGFVEMSSDAEAQKAIELLNGQDFQGRKLTVNVARPMQPRAPREGGNNW